MIKVNQLILAPNGIKELKPGLYRVVLTATKEDLAALFWMGDHESVNGLKPDKHTQRPQTIELSTLLQHLDKQMIQLVPEVSFDLPHNRQRGGDNAEKRFSKNWKILASLIEPDALHSMLINQSWRRDTKITAKNCNVNIITVQRLLARYFTLSMNVEWACEDRLWVKGKRRNITKKLGRPAQRFKTQHNVAAEGRNATEGDRSAVIAFYDSQEKQNLSMARMYENFKQYFQPLKAVLKPEGNIDLVLNASGTCITESQFRYALKKSKGELTLLTDTIDQKRIALSHRPALGSARDRVPYPGHTYIVDATIGDLYLLSAFDRRRIIGRPVIYLVVDAFSSLIVSVHVALAGPNFEEARIAMYRAISDKSTWLRWLGLSDLAPLLPQGCLPSFWLVDRGELHSKANRTLQTNLRCNLSIAAAYRADWKSLVERMFGILNTELIHWIPGAVVQRMRERGTPDCRLDAVLTVKEFTRVLVRKAALLNLTRNISDHMSSALISADIKPNPLGFYNYGIQHKHGSAVFLNIESSMRKALNAEAATLSRHGMLLRKMQYRGEWMSDHPTLRLAGFHGPIPVQAIKSPDDPLAAWCLLPNESGMREVRLHKGFERASQFSTEDVMEITALRQFLGQDLKDETSAQKISIDRENRQDIKSAKDNTQSELRISPVSKASRLKHIRKNRHEEKSLASDETSSNQGNYQHTNCTNEECTKPEVSLATHQVKSDDQGYYERMSAQLKDWGNP